MGLFSKLFGGGHQDPPLPPLPPDSPLHARIHDINDHLSKLADEVRQPLEVLPLPNAAYVFIGNPPKRFGMAWVHDGEISGFKALVEEKGVAPAEIEKLAKKLQDAYAAAEDAQRFSVDLGEHKVVVTDSLALTAQVDNMVRKLTG
jgi:hypothetical protein